MEKATPTYRGNSILSGGRGAIRALVLPVPAVAPSEHFLTRRILTLSMTFCNQR